MAKPGRLVRIEKEFSRIGLLLQHDRELPSFTTLLAGQPIKGSWWGHALGHDIFDLLGEFEKGAGALSATWVNGKITYVHRRLWRAFLTVVQPRDSARARELSPLARSLYKVVLRQGIVRADELAASGFAASRSIATAGRELERGLLVRAASMHTASGAHAKTFQSWSHWAAGVEMSGVEPALLEARGQLAEAVDRLRQGTSRRVTAALLPASG